jgi:hypothetical protein
MTLDEQKKAVMALFDEAAGWGVPALDARHLPRIAGALGIGMPEPVRVPPAQVIVPDPMHEGAGVLHAEPVRVPPVQELEARMHEGTGVLHAAQPEEVLPPQTAGAVSQIGIWKETRYGKLPTCRFNPLAKITGAQANRIAEDFCRRMNVERCAVEPEAMLCAMARANSAHKQGYFVSETHFVFGLRQMRFYANRRPALKLKGERHV